RNQFEEAGVRVLDVIQAHDGRWYAPLGRRGVSRDGVAYDVTAHPYRAQAILEGRAFASSREELAARLEPIPTAVASVEAALGDLWDSVPESVRRGLEERGGDAVSPVAVAALATIRPSGPALRAMLDGHLLAGTVPDDRDAARILLAAHRASTR